jgi:WD40 repeat protein
MPRIFLSHSGHDNRQAIALRQWLIEQNPPLADEIYLDLDPDTGIQGGERWKDALRQASSRCEAVICLLSPNWEASLECRTEYRFAEYLNKRIFTALIAPLTEDDPTREWQQIALLDDGATTPIDLHDGGEPVRFSSQGLYRLRQGIIGSGIAAESFAWPPPDDPLRAPYRGWEPLEGADAAIYFGRNAEILRGLDTLRRMRRTGAETLFVVLGPSGTGKSSFLRAGLLPRVSRDDREFVVLDIVRPQRNVLTGDTGLARAIYASRLRLALTEPSLGAIKRACNASDIGFLEGLLLEIQHAASARLLVEAGELPLPTLVLPVDQGEELFGPDAGIEAPRFLDVIAALVTAYGDNPRSGGLGLIVALTIRTDRYVSLQTAPQLAATQTVVFDELKPMPRTQFKEVITGPAERATQGGHPLAIEEALINRLLDDCIEGADTLPLLALTLSRLYEDYAVATPGANDSTLMLDHYESMGGMRSVVRSEINNLLSANPIGRAADLRSLRSAFIPWLATVNPENDQPVRRLARWTDLPEDSRPLIEKFVAGRLLVRDDREGEATVEVALESLLRQWDELAAWLSEERENLKAADSVENAALAWRANHRDDAWLLQGTRLVEAQTLAVESAFRDRLSRIRDYLGASQEREDSRVEAERQQREAKVVAAQKLAATETAAREQAEAHAAALRKRSRVLRAVLAVTLVVAIFAAAGFVAAAWAWRRAEAATRDAVALRLTAEGQAILAGINPGGDTRALREILAAPRISSAADQSAQLLAITSRRATLKIINQPSEVTSAVFDRGGQHIVSGSADSTVRRWKADTGQPIGEPLKGHTGQVNSVAFSPDGHRIASASDDRTIRIWNADTGEPIGQPLVGHSAEVRSVAFSPGGHMIVSGSQDATVRLWNADTGQPIGDPLTGHRDSVWSVAFNYDGSRIISASGDQTIRQWDTVSHLPIGEPLKGHDGAVRSAAFSPDGNRIVSASADRTVRLWNAHGGQQIGAPLRGHTDIVRSVAFSPDGHRIVSASRDKTVRLWNADTGNPIGDPLEGHTEPVSSAVFDLDGKRILSASDDQTARIWAGDPGQSVGTALTGHIGAVRSVAFSPDGHRIASASDDRTVRIWNADTGEPIDAPLKGHTDAVNTVAFSPDGHRIASGGDTDDETVRIWNADTGEPIGAPLKGHTDAVYSIAFSPDGHRIVSGSADHQLRLWNADTGQPIGNPLEGHDSVVRSVAFSPDGHRIVSGGDDHTVRVWDADTGKPIGDPLRHDNIVRSVAFSPDGHRIVSGGFDKALRLWDAETLAPVGALRTTDWVFSVVYGPGGDRLLTGSVDHSLRLWNTDTRQTMGPPLNQPGEVNSVAFSADGRRMVSGGSDNTVWVWPGPAVWPELLCDKLTANMSYRQWGQWVSKDFDYERVCKDLPVAPDG